MGRMAIPVTDPDVISALAGVQRDSGLAELRAQRPAAARHAQGSYQALFFSEAPSDLSRAERFAVAGDVSQLHGDAVAKAHYAGQLGEGGLLTDGKRRADRWPTLQRHAEL